MSKPFLIVVHDAAPLFEAELAAIFEQLNQRVGPRFSCAVVPNWHDEFRWDRNSGVASLLKHCDELLLHGWIHRRAASLSPVSWLAGRPDEFNGLTPAVIQQRIDWGLGELRGALDLQPNGMIPPAWQLPVSSPDVSGLDYVMRFRRLESCSDASSAVRLATWSWDWGRLRLFEWPGDWFGSLQHWLEPSVVPCVAIHPVDVPHGWLPRIDGLVQKFLDNGFTPVTPGELMASGTS